VSFAGYFYHKKRRLIETFIYGTREKLNAELHPYTDTQEANQILQIFSEAENWLYNSNEETFNKSKLEDVFNRVTGAGNKIYNRKSAWDQLESSLNTMRTSINKHVSRFEEQFKLAKDNKSLLLKNEMDDLQKVIQTYNDVYNEAVNGLAGAKKLIDPPISAGNVKQQNKDLDDKVNKIFSDADKRVKEAERKLQEEIKKAEEQKKKEKEQTTNSTTTNNSNTTNKTDTETTQNTNSNNGKKDEEMRLD